MLLVCTLSFSLFLPETGFSRNEVVKDSLDNPTLLNKEETLKQTFDQTEMSTGMKSHLQMRHNCKHTYETYSVR